MNEYSTHTNTIVSVEPDSGTVFLVGGLADWQVARTAEDGACERAGKEDIDPHTVAQARDWRPSEVTFLTGQAGDTLKRLIDTGRAADTERAARLYFCEHPQAFGPAPRD